MARQEVPSTFSDGLMMDLNPINTPKSVLTDCLNGTYITYNGNEFVLQNDMGNYKLKNCKLPTNFIPVGVKGYGDILYIVSYNPITKETEIGSYPAPQSVFSSGNKKIGPKDNSLCPFTWGPNENTVEYSDLIKSNKKPIYIFTGPDTETYKLNPGDEFKFTGKVSPLEFIYQHLDFYIIDEDNKLYDIDDSQIYVKDNTLETEELRKVFWETPGWLAAQYDLYVPDKFNLNLKSLNVPEFLVSQSNNNRLKQINEQSLDELIPDNEHFKVSMDLSSQTIITDQLFQKELTKHFGHELADTYDHLYVRYLIKRNKSVPEGSEEDYGTFKGIVVSIDNEHTKDYIKGVLTKEEDYIYYDIPVWKHNYQDDVITAYNNIRPIWFCKSPIKKEKTEDLDIANYHGTVEIMAYPVIKYNGLTLKYTQFSTTQKFPLNTLKNSSDVTIADSIYKWSVDDDSCTISFNINGPFINTSDITGRYEIYRINLFNLASDEQGAKTQASAGTNKNPKSVSFYNVSDKLTGDFLVKENNKWIRKLNQSVSANSFTSEKKLLMCEGRLSNIVLYGQNTLNINWNSSKEYILNTYCNYYTNPDYDFTEGADNGGLEKAVKDTSFVGYNEENPQKTINFSKEGGIYIFRVILEQNGSQLAESKQVLIPSEVFNEWFGSIDNYLDKTNGITSSMWVGRWMEFVSQSLIINDLNVDFNTTVNTEDETWDEFVLNYETEKVPLELKYKTNETSADKIDWEQTIVHGMKKVSDNTYQWLSIPSTFNYSVNISKLNPQITLKDSDTSINKLEGNLWNPILLGNTVLKTNTNDEIISLKIDGSASFIKSIKIPWNLINLNSVNAYPEISDRIYLFDPPKNILTQKHNVPYVKVYGDQPNGRTTVRMNYDVKWLKKDNDDNNNLIYSGYYSIREDNKYTTCDDEPFKVIGDSMKQSNSSWAKAEYNIGGVSSSKTQVCLFKDSDDDSDKEYKEPIYDVPYNCIQLFAIGGNSILNEKTVAIHFSDDQKMIKFVWGLMYIVAVNYSNVPTITHHPTFKFNNIIENEILNLTKYITNLSLVYLRVDDLIINKNLSDLNKYSKTLFSNPIFNLNKTIQNSMSNLMVNLNYSDNIKYKNFIDGIVTGMGVFNYIQQTEIKEINTSLQGAHLIVANVAAPNSSILEELGFGSNSTISNVAKDTAKKIIPKLSKRDIRYNYSVMNVGYNNESQNTLKWINGHKKDYGDVTTNSGSILMCYTEDFNF